MSKMIYGVWEDEELLKEGIVKLKEQGVVCRDVQSPFPVHGVEHLLNIPRTRISITAFMYGITGTSLALLMTWYMMVHDWQINIGGKPNFALYLNLPAFIPVTFEMTVFCAAHGMVITYLLRSKLLPGVTAPMPVKGITDDKFVLHVEVKNESMVSAVASQIRNAGALDVKI